MLSATALTRPDGFPEVESLRPGTSRRGSSEAKWPIG